jgi:hypothetical protein
MQPTFKTVSLKTQRGRRLVESLKSKGYDHTYLGLTTVMFEIQKPNFTNQNKKQ